MFAFCLNDKFEVSSEVNDAANVSDDIAANSEPIIVDNLIVGAIYENTWVSTNKYYLKSNKKTDLETYVYDIDSRAGEYIIEDKTKYKKLYNKYFYHNYLVLR